MVERADLTGTKLGNYRLEKLLGAGRMGVVYLARDEALLRPTAVKILSWEMPPQQGYDPEAWFLAEARNVARINHPSVIQIYNVARHGPHCYIAMEYVDGLSADALVANSGPLPVERATSILLQVATALQAAHDSNVIHRDIKPENLLVRADDVAKLGDFGMAMHVQAANAAEASRAGTPYYTAPEIWHGAAANALTDIYALGATYFYLMVGHSPVRARDLDGLIRAHLQGEIEDIRSIVPGIPEQCRLIISKCMARQPEHRYTTAQALAWEAKGFLRELRRGGPPAIIERAPLIKKTPPAKRLPICAWAEFFGFETLPFVGTDPMACPAIGEPFHSTAAALTKCLKAKDASSILFLGPEGSGRTTVVRKLINRLTGLGPIAYVSQEVGANCGIIQQAARVLGAIVEGPSQPDKSIEPLLEQLEIRAEHDSKRALIVIDNVVPSAGYARELTTLVEAAKATRFFNVLCIGPAELEVLLRKQGVFSSNSQPPVVMMRALNGTQTLSYLTEWLNASQGANAQPVIVTPDAALLICHQTGGIASKINQLALRMLCLGWLEKQRVLSSWHARAALDFLISQNDQAMQAPARPDPWPTAEVLKILNELRRDNGMPERCQQE